jgi:hypothetical protein
MTGKAESDTVRSRSLVGHKTDSLGMTALRPGAGKQREILRCAQDDGREARDDNKRKEPARRQRYKGERRGIDYEQSRGYTRRSFGVEYEHGNY